MDFHLPTLYLAAIVLTAAMALVTSAAAWRNPSLRLSRTAQALGLSLAAFVLFRFRDSIGAPLAVLLGNVAMSLALSQYAVGLLDMLNRRLHRVARWLPVLAVGGISLALPDNTAARLPLIGVVMSLQSGVLVWTLLQHRQSERMVGYGCLLIGVAGCMGIFAVRALASVLLPESIGGFDTRQTLSLVTIVVLLAGLVFMATGTLVMALEQQVRRNQQLALVDTLTGLPNRRHVLEHLDRTLSMARRSGEPLSLLMLDIDHFKQVNDTHGHAAGDAVLVRVGEVLRGRLRGHDMAARFGGEEFVVLLPGTDAVGAHQLAQTLREALASDPITLSTGTPIAFTASIGLCTGYPGPDLNAAALISTADAAMYMAKADGRNRVRSLPWPTTAATPR